MSNPPLQNPPPYLGVGKSCSGARWDERYAANKCTDVHVVHYPVPSSSSGLSPVSLSREYVGGG